MPEEETSSETETYLFGGFELRAAENRLRRDGEEVEIQQKALALIAYLLRHRARNVSKEELQDALWPKTIVTEAALTRAVMKARKALGESAEQAGWIRTIHGFGYRFEGPVQLSAEPITLPDQPTPPDPDTPTEATASEAPPAAARRTGGRHHQLLRSLAAYGAFAWLLNQGAALVWEAFEWSRDGQQWLLVASLAGALPVALVAWIAGGRAAIAHAAAPDRDNQQGEGYRWLSATTLFMLLVALCISLYWNFRPERGTPLAENRIAVLPFRSEGDARIAAGLTDALRNTLAQEQRVAVSASASSDRYADGSGSARQIASALGAGLLVEGRVHAHRDTLRATAALISGQTGERLWSTQLDHPADDLFALEDALGQTLLARVREHFALPTQITAARSSRARRGTADLAAYRAYREGRAAQRQETRDDVTRALALYEQALALDPDYAKAWAGLAQCELTLALWGVGSRPARMAAAREAADNATAYDDQLALPYMVRAQIKARYEWKFAAAAEELETALRLAPNDSDLLATQAILLSRMGQHERAAALARRAWAADPLSAAVAATLTTRLLRAGDIEGAARSLDALLALNPEHGDRHWLRAQLELRRGDPAAAREAIAGDELAYLRLTITSIASHQLGDAEAAQRDLDTLIETDSEGAAFQIAEIYAQRSDSAQAMRWLERGYEQRDPGVGELLSSPMFEPLYDDTEFRAFAARMQLTP